VPTVQRYGNRKVGTDALPGVRGTATETPTSTGAGVAAAEQNRAEAGVGLAATVAHLATQQIAADVAKERRHANDVALLEASNAADAADNDFLYNPETGALGRKGKVAQSLPEENRAAFDKSYGAIERGLNTDEQRNAFAKMKTQRWQQRDGTVQRHVFTERKTYEAQELSAFVDNRHNAAVAGAADETVVHQQIVDGVAAIRNSAPRLGLGPEAVEQRVGDFQSKTVVGVIDNLLDHGDPAKAAEYFKANKDLVTDAEALNHVEKALKIGSTQAEALAAADTIINAGGTRKEQLAQAAKVNPNIREHVEARIERAAAVKDRETREAEEGLLDTVYARLNRNGGDMTSLTPTEQEKLGRHLPALESFALKRAKGEPVVTDLPTYYALQTLAGTKPDAFVKENLLAYSGKVDEGDLKTLITMQRGMRTGDRTEADKHLADFRTKKELVDGSLDQYGIPTDEKHQTPAQKAGVAQLYRMLDEKTKVLQGGGKKATNEDLQAEIDRVLGRQVKTLSQGYLWNSETSTRISELTIADVTPNERAALAAALRQRQQPVTDVTMLNLYIANRMKSGR